MRIIVCVKAVPGSTEVKMDPKTNTIVRDGKQAVINPFDASALELALQIREKLAADGEDVSISVLSMGIPATAELLRDCIARGATSGLLLSDRAFAGADTLATTYALSLGIEQIGAADLIVCGKMAVDGDTAQIGPELAGTFDIPCITDVAELLDIDAHALRARHATDEGHDVVDVPLPAVITVSKDAAQLRMPSIAGIMDAAGADVRVVSASEAEADPARCGLAGSPTQVVRSFVPEREHECTFIEGGADAAAARIADMIKGME